ncbi:MAG: threonylcarbamoyl-AMP synthase [Chloroflexi bacterium]|nr:threonylcarbamoyl-AMP synthase [Chloroflexota bacterium]
MPPTAGDERIEAWIRQAVAILIRGGVVAFPTDTVYGLGADIFNVAAVERVFHAKRRQADRPLPVLLADQSDVDLVAREFHDDAARLAERFWPGPLTLVLPRRSEVPDIVTGGTDSVGVRVPAHEVPRLLVDALRRPVTGTSANSSGHPPHLDPEWVERDLGDRVDLVIPGSCGLDRKPSTVVDCTGQVPVVIRTGALSIEQLQSVVPDAIEATNQDYAAGSSDRLTESRKRQD